MTAALGMWASTLPPSPAVVELGAWSYSAKSDPIATKRILLIASGIITPILAALFAIGTDPRDKRDLLHIALILACVTACFSFGWRGIPYWANGVYQTDLGHFKYMDMDPKGLPPGNFLGAFWSLPVLLFPLWLFLLSGLVFPMLSWAWQRDRARALPILAILIVGVAWIPLFWRVKDYTSWLLD